MPKGNKKGKKNKEPKVSYYQAITSFKITVKEKEISDLKEEFKRLFDVNQNLKQRNLRLDETKHYNMEKATKEYKSLNRDLNLRENFSRDQVLNELKDLWRYKLSEEKHLINQKREMKRLEREINDEKRELQAWTDFRDYDQHHLSTKIRLLKKEYDDMTENYNIMSESIKNSLSSSIEKIKITTEEAIQRKNKSAAQKAFHHMDKSVIDMSHENKWMQKQVEMFKLEIQKLEDDASSLEKENINLMGHLFDCNNEEFNCIKELFDFQFIDDDNLEENSIMKVDLKDLEIVRPNSALSRSIAKLKEISSKNLEKQQCIDDSDDSKNKKPIELEAPQSPRFLCLYGFRKELIKTQTNEQNESLKADPSYTNQFWPITQSMLKDVLNS